MALPSTTRRFYTGCSSLQANRTNMLVYLIGTLFVVAGLAYGATRLGISNVWIVAAALVIIESAAGALPRTARTLDRAPAFDVDLDLAGSGAAEAAARRRAGRDSDAARRC